MSETQPYRVEQENSPVDHAPYWRVIGPNYLAPRRGVKGVAEMECDALNAAFAAGAASRPSSGAERVVEAAHALAREWTPQHIAKTPLDAAVVNVILALRSAPQPAPDADALAREAAEILFRKMIMASSASSGPFGVPEIKMVIARAIRAGRGEATDGQ